LAAQAAPKKKAAPKSAAPKPAAQRAPVQTKLEVGAANDRFEQEADRVAQRVGQAHAPASPPPMISGLRAQRLPATPPPGPEAKKGEKVPKPPEKRAQAKPASDPKKTPKPAATPKSAGKAQRKAADPPPKKAPKPAKPAQRKTAAPAERKKDPPARAQRKAATSDTAPEHKERKPPKTPEKRGQRKAQPAAAPNNQTKDKQPKAKAQRDAAPQTPAVSMDGGAAPAPVESSIDRMRGRGAPGLDPALKSRVEAAVGTDLGGVRVHRDKAAADAASALGAKAFTVGQDMFFGSGQYNPTTLAGQQLIAHEATHTVQQSGGSGPARRVQRAKTEKDDKKTTPLTKTNELKGEKAGEKWSIELHKGEGAGTITVPRLELPKVADKLKGEDNPKNEPVARNGKLPAANQPYTRPPQPPRVERTTEGAFEVWVKYMREKTKGSFPDKLKAQITAQTDAAVLNNPEDKDVYVLRRKTENKSGGADDLGGLLIGTIAELSQSDGLLRPMIDKHTGAYAAYDADHILEDQLGGLDSAKNMWLLDRYYNRSVGSSIKSRIDVSLKTVIAEAETANKNQRDNKHEEFADQIPDVEHIKRNWTIEFATVVQGAKFPDTKNWWSRTEIENGGQLTSFKALSAKELVDQGFKFDAGHRPKRINVFPTREGGRPFPFVVSQDGQFLTLKGDFFRGMRLGEEPIKYKPPEGGKAGKVIASLPVVYSKRKEKGKKDSGLIELGGTVDVTYEPRFGFGGYVTRDSIMALVSTGKFKPLSPMAFADAGLDSSGELKATGQIDTDKKLFPKLSVPVALRGDDILIDFPLPDKGLDLGPLKFRNPALELGVNSDTGFFIGGSVETYVDGVGSGVITARGSGDDVVLGGEFKLDMDFLNKPEVKVEYHLKDDAFKAEGHFDLNKTALPGVESGKVDVVITRESFGLTGELHLGGMLKGATLTAGYTPETGLLIEGKDIPVPVNKVPGVSDAAITVKVARGAQDSGWSVSGGGKATLSAGGASGSLDILFDGQVFSITGRADVAKGPAHGWLQITATNRQVDADGKPKEDGRPDTQLHIWGEGEASVTFGKIITGTAGIQYTPKGDVILSGEIALPPTYDIFPKKDLSPKEPLFKTPEIDFPIWGVELGPVEFGIFAFVDAKVTAEAWIGPGQLQDAAVHATIDLEKPEDAVVDGHAKFYVPAFAGLTLDVGGGVKASAAVAFVKGRIGLYGSLGVAAAGEFDVDVHWDQPNGLAVKADAKIDAHPQFEVGVNASITAGVDLGLFDIDKTWGPWKKPLGSFGPNMDLGVSMPIAWSEKDGLKAETPHFQTPKIDAQEMMQSGFDTLVG
jgi:hypothetical protein